jgi:hypothetical protein
MYADGSDGALISPKSFMITIYRYGSVSATRNKALEIAILRLEDMVGVSKETLQLR